jgi:hypothetical protein
MGIDFDWAAHVSHAMVPEPAGEFTSSSEYMPGQRDALFGDDGFTFADLIDVINPLQHIPVISTIYRELTGDMIDAAPRVLGGALFGGPIGGAAAVVNAMIDGTTGKDIGEHVVALFTGDGGEGEAVAGIAEGAARPGKPPGEIPVATSGLAAVAAASEPGSSGGGLAETETAGGGQKPSVPTIAASGFADLRHPAFAGSAAPAAISPAPPGRAGNAFADLRHPKFGTTETGAAASAAKTAAEQRAANAWLYQAMMRALDKYETGTQLAQPQALPVRSVVR